MADVTAIERSATNLATLLGTTGDQMTLDDQGVEIWSEAQTLSNNDDIIIDETTSKLAIRRFAHVFASVHLYNSSGTELVSAGGGEFAIGVKTRNCGQWETPNNATIDATAPHTVNWAGNTFAVRAVYDHNVTGEALTWRLCITANKT